RSLLAFQLRYEHRQHAGWGCWHSIGRILRLRAWTLLHAVDKHRPFSQRAPPRCRPIRSVAGGERDQGTISREGLRPNVAEPAGDAFRVWADRELGVPRAPGAAECQRYQPGPTATGTADDGSIRKLSSHCRTYIKANPPLSLRGRVNRGARRCAARRAFSPLDTQPTRTYPWSFGTLTDIWCGKGTQSTAGSSRLTERG